ncbi:MAG: flagellar basal body rod protein FlgB, partial [Clostridiales bacterium]|nr:flagellar basal body rod protein FlgB [Clostridiales bacterium]
AQNAANVDTPNYKRKTVEFEDFLKAAMDESDFKGFTTDSRHVQIGGNLDTVSPLVTEDHSSMSYRLDGNNVDIESEMAAMAENSIKYNTLVESLSAGYSKLRYVISEGRK